MPPVGFEPTISADERPQTYALDRAAIGTGKRKSLVNEIMIKCLGMQLSYMTLCDEPLSTLRLWYVVRQSYRQTVVVLRRFSFQSGFRSELLTFRRRIKSRLPFAGIIVMLPYSTRFQDKG